MTDLHKLISDLIAEGEAKNRRAANDLYATLVDIARTGSGTDQRVAQRAINRRNQGN